MSNKRQIYSPPKMRILRWELLASAVLEGMASDDELGLIDAAFVQQSSSLDEWISYREVIVSNDSEIDEASIRGLHDLRIDDGPASVWVHLCQAGFCKTAKVMVDVPDVRRILAAILFLPDWTTRLAFEGDFENWDGERGR